MPWSSRRTSITWCCSPATAISARWSRRCSAAACASRSISTISTQPPMVADELRRQADIFIDIVELQSKIGRDPSERPAREPREPRGERAAHAAIPAARPAPRERRRRRGRRRRFRGLIGRRRVRTIADHGWPNRQSRPRLSALSAARRLPPDLARARAVWFNAPVPSFGPLDARLLIVGLAPGPARRQPHRPAVHRRLRRRPALRHAEGIRLRPRRVRGAARRRA